MKSHPTIGGILLLVILSPGVYAAAAQADDGRKREAGLAYNKAVAAAERGDRKAAEAGYRKAIKLDPTHADAHNNLGVVLEERGAIADAETAYRSAVALNPRLRAAHANLGKLLYENGRFAESEAVLLPLVRALESETASREGPDAADAIKARGQLGDAQFLLGLASAAQAKHAEAIAAFRAAIGAKPAHALSHHYLGVSLAQTGDTAAATRALREAIRCDPGLAEAHFNLGALLYQAGQNAQAVDAFRAFLRLRPDAPNRAQVEAAIDQMTSQ